MFFFVVNRFLFYENISGIVCNETNCPRHEFKSFSVCDMTFKFLNTMIPRSNTRCCACVRLLHTLGKLSSPFIIPLYRFRGRWSVDIARQRQTRHTGYNIPTDGQTWVYKEELHCSGSYIENKTVWVKISSLYRFSKWVQLDIQVW